MGIISLARGRPPLLAAWPACAPLAEGDSSSTTTGGGGSHVPTPLHVPVFLTPSPGSNPEEARRAALSALKRCVVGVLGGWVGEQAVLGGPARNRQIEN